MTIDSRLLARACDLYTTTPGKLVPLSGGHYNAVYQYPTAGGAAILRIGREDCLPGQTLAMLEWVSFLAENGAPVNAPLISQPGNFMETLEFEGMHYTVTAFRKAEGVLAENIPLVEWTPSLFRLIGQAVGRFHRTSVAYKPSSALPARPNWNESIEIIAAHSKLRDTLAPADGILKHLIQYLERLPITAEDYGLIHGDLHFANFLAQVDGTVTIIDFDDCCYGWFAMDLAMALFDVLVLYDPVGDAEAQEFARQFLSSYLAGYRQEYKLTRFWLMQLPKFLKLKELCIYAAVYDHPDAARPNSWVGKFMRRRASRIAEDLPYVEIDFQDF